MVEVQSFLLCRSIGQAPNALPVLHQAGIYQLFPQRRVHWPKVGENLESLMLFRGL